MKAKLVFGKKGFLRVEDMKGKKIDLTPKKKTREKWYKVYWSLKEGAISYVKAKNKTEAKKLADMGEDVEFESDADVYGTCSEWNIDYVEPADEKDE